jgi:hypothetical protein
MVQAGLTTAGLIDDVGRAGSGHRRIAIYDGRLDG